MKCYRHVLSLKQWQKGVMAILGLTLILSAHAVLGASQTQATNLESAKIIKLSNKHIELQLEFNGKVPTPSVFALHKPERMVLDFDDTGNTIGNGALPVDSNDLVKAVFAIRINNRLRIILNLTSSASYSLRQQQQTLFIDLMPGEMKQATAAPLKPELKTIVQQQLAQPSLSQIIDIKAQRTASGGDQIIVGLSDTKIPVNLYQDDRNRLVVDFSGTNLDPSISRFQSLENSANLIKSIAWVPETNKQQLLITPTRDYHFVGYQINKNFIIEVSPNQISAADNNPVITETGSKAAAGMPASIAGTPQLKLQPLSLSGSHHYSGNRISLDFQDIKVRAVLQILAEFTGMNIVASDSVKGSITLRLQSVPWDQALDIILRTQGLDKRQVGNVLLIAPTDEIANYEKQTLMAQQQVAGLEPLKSELIQINYAKASDIATLLKDKGNSVLSERGNVTIDARTNTLWVQDNPKKLQEVRKFIQRLDIAVTQVLIEARIVNVNTDFERDIGIRFGVTRPQHISGTYEGASDLATGTSASAVDPLERLNVNLQAPTAGLGLDPGTLGIALAKLGSEVLLDMELSALEQEGKGEIISNPRLVTANQQAAYIESGEEIPYQEATSSGATSVQFKKAVLSLQVTPQITPDGRIILYLKVNQDSRGTVTAGIPAINTRQIETNVLVNNGETVVLGGIYEVNTARKITRVPFLGTLPWVGALFRSKQETDHRKELLIFVTPKIIKQKSYNTKTT